MLKSKTQGFFSDEIEEQHKGEWKMNDPLCNKCGLDKKCFSPKMDPTGNMKKEVLIIGDVNDQAEDQAGTHLVGAAGQYLRTTLQKFGVDLEQDFYKTNAIGCHPTTKSGANRKPTKSELKYCKPLLDAIIKKVNPKMIWLMGNSAVDSFYMGRFSSTVINRWRKLCIPDRVTSAWVIPLFDPSSVLNSKYDANLKATFERDLQWAVSCIGREFPDFPDEEKQIKKLSSLDQIIPTLKEVLKKAGDRDIQLYFDYETNSLKAQWKLSKIASVSFRVRGEEFAYAFPYCYQDYFNEKERRKIKMSWRKILTHPNIGLIANNIKFEDSWSRNIFGVRPINWIADPMLTAHILDNRRAYTGLKFQSYINFGIEPYNKNVDKFLKAGKQSPYNKIDDANLGELLLYGGVDSFIGMNLYEKQLESYTLSPNLYPKNKFPQATRLFREGTLALSDVQENGIYIDVDYYKKENSRLGRRIDSLKTRLADGDESIKFKQAQNKQLDLGSNTDLGILFYKVLGAPEQKTPKGNYCVDKNALENIDLPFVKDLLRLRKLEKIKNTYFAQLLREVCGDKIHGFFGLNIPVSYRSSSQAPNWQNIPAHDEEAGRYVRTGIIPSPGNKLAEIDYSSIEVRVASIITCDPALKNYVLNPQADMHMDVSKDIWCLPESEVTKTIRFHSKGGWTFAQFYGSYYKQCAENLWKNVDLKTTSGMTLRQNLADNGIKNYNNFVAHCKKVENIFWNDRFKVYAQWKKDINKEYRRKGYIETPFGFRYTGYMTDKEVCNYKIQGTAFHILLDSLTRINKIAQEEKWKSKIIGQIHDSILLDIHPKEEEHVLTTCVHEMDTRARELHSWIDIPIPVDVECSETNGSWWEKKEIEI